MKDKELADFHKMGSPGRGSCFLFPNLDQQGDRKLTVWFLFNESRQEIRGTECFFLALIESDHSEVIQAEGKRTAKKPSTQTRQNNVKGRGRRRQPYLVWAVSTEL